MLAKLISESKKDGGDVNLASSAATSPTVGLPALNTIVQQHDDENAFASPQFSIGEMEMEEEDDELNDANLDHLLARMKTKTKNRDFADNLVDDQT